MGITFEEGLNNLIELQKDYQQFHDDVWQDPESCGIIAESLRIGIEIMRKYQKIEQIYKEWFTDKYCTRAEAYTRIVDVLKDRNER